MTGTCGSWRIAYDDLKPLRYSTVQRGRPGESEGDPDCARLGQKRFGHDLGNRIGTAVMLASFFDTWVRGRGLRPNSVI